MFNQFSSGLMNYMVNNKFTALGRTVIINEVGDRLSDYILQNFNGKGYDYLSP